eukprot:scaffold657030_cov57-Prasinocladus_malaysianus.AAC.2
MFEGGARAEVWRLVLLQRILEVDYQIPKNLTVSSLVSTIVLPVIMLHCQSQQSVKSRIAHAGVERMPGPPSSDLGQRSGSQAHPARHSEPSFLHP